jgi:rRNA maturation endonuclease Nob1
MFEGRKIVIATKHKKEQVITPVLKKELGLNVFVSKDLDTDVFGTFTGEVERKDGPLETLRRKAEMGMVHTGLDLAIASEGSFGPHPTLFFVPAADEILMFKDTKNDLEIVAREVSTDTNYGSAEVQSEEELFAFAERSLFPTHALILSDACDNAKAFVKGIATQEELLKVFHELKHKAKTVLVQTDMRALYNPTRMKTIEKACHKLMKNIKSSCPGCVTPGYNVSDVLSGLPCSLCGRPTKSTLAHQYVCKKCGYKELRYYPNLKLQEEPTFCDYCNP